MQLKKKLKKGIARMWLAIAAAIVIIIAVIIFLLGAGTTVVYAPMPP